MMKSNIGAIVLAAGLSKRMGTPKMLLPFGGKPMIARIIETLSAINNISSIIVVIGHHASEIKAVLETYQVEIVNNEDYVSGEMISSVKKGVRSLPNNVEAFLVVLGDQPLIQYSIINILLAKWKETGTAIIHPVYFGKRGHPVLFDISCAGGILSLSSQETLKSFIASNEERLCEVAVEDKAVTVDIDTPEDYEQALSLLQSS